MSAAFPATQNDTGRPTDQPALTAGWPGPLGGGGVGVGGRSIGSGGPAMGAQRRRRASMQDALDYTKINASLYDTTTLVINFYYTFVSADSSRAMR
jgi:hypothetical protein